MSAGHSHQSAALGRYRSAAWTVITLNPTEQKVTITGGSESILAVNMCEWLSHSEWCDVKLLCGGRSFNAHRAVLASVSSFLRRILLACPADETPTLIVLPDFDLEALSSVLYYIYNGEVILQKHKLGFFLDIIQTMQIYIDCQYLPKVRENAEEGNLEFNSSIDSNTPKTEIFTLGCEEDKGQRFINIKRGTEIQSVLLQYSHRETDFHDNEVRCQNESELRRSRLGNLKLPCGDRQRNSFLRDLFIETYPRNGNVNGLTESVLAISNEHYRPPASVLSTNANGEHLGNDHSHAGFCTKTTQQTLNMSAIIQSGQRPHCRNNYNGKCKPTSARVNANLPCIKYPTHSRDMTFVYGKSETVAGFPNDRISFLPQQLNENNVLSPINTTHLDFQQSFLNVMKCHLFKDSQYAVAPNFPVEYKGGGRSNSIKPNTSPKVIFNQVLENPWSPRKPNNYRPLQRKRENSSMEIYRLEKIGVVNDSNNNQTPVMVAAENLSDRESFEARDLPEASSPLPTGVGQDFFKCTHCSQVFTSSESLAVHMRRHSTNARYTCGECGKTFSQLRNFKYHMSIHRGTREFAATCSVCGKYFNDRGYLSSHMKIHRNRKEYKCNLCPKSFNQRVAYNMHVRIHTGVKPHVCEECGKAFSRKMLLKQHQRTHSGERPYACPHCDKRFADRSNMTLHLRLHTGVKPFSCSLCPKSFTKKHHLKSHLNFHTGSKPYSCPRCKLAFTQSSNMRTHYKKCSASDLGDSNTDPASGNSQSNF